MVTGANEWQDGAANWLRLLLRTRFNGRPGAARFERPHQSYDQQRPAEHLSVDFGHDSGKLLRYRSQPAVPAPCLSAGLQDPGKDSAVLGIDPAAASQ